MKILINERDNKFKNVEDIEINGSHVIAALA